MNMHLENVFVKSLIYTFVNEFRYRCHSMPHIGKNFFNRLNIALSPSVTREMGLLFIITIRNVSNTHSYVPILSFINSSQPNTTVW